MIALLPLTFIGYFLWLFALQFRNPFIYQSTVAKNSAMSQHQQQPNKSLVLLSLNAKLLPESRSRTFNLGHVCRRSRQIANVILHSSSQGRAMGEPSIAGKSSVFQPHGDSISQVSYGNYDKSTAYGDNFSENRSMISGAAVDVFVSGTTYNQNPNANSNQNGESYSLGPSGTAGTNVKHLAADQITVSSLRSVEGMWQKRASGKVNSHFLIEASINFLFYFTYRKKQIQYLL